MMTTQQQYQWSRHPMAPPKLVARVPLVPVYKVLDGVYACVCALKAHTHFAMDSGGFQLIMEPLTAHHLMSNPEVVERSKLVGMGGAAEDHKARILNWGLFWGGY